MAKKQIKSKSITMKDLGQFTEEVIFPGVEKILDDRMGSMKDEIINEVSKRTIQSNDEVITKLDALIKDNAAHTMSHHRIDDTFHGHDKRIKKLEETHHH